jgi:hypothetical protein
MELHLPTPVSHPPSCRMRPLSQVAYPPQKYICKYKKIPKLGKMLFYNNNKSDKEFDKLTFGNSEFVESKIWPNQNFDKPCI